MTSKEIAQEAIAKMNKRITNEIFLIIQNDRKLMHEYLRAVEANGLDSLNQSIGKEVKKIYQLTNLNDREDNPSCTLIQSHQKFD
ncbi:MAG: hypothetical protein H8D56_12530 [Planctomycetes bacterium]|nr:hypothetical protein [Planctomycetota bacterium]